MLEREIMAININNLSDARYFSAKGVMWMTFSVQEGQDNIQQIKEMMSWIAGPEPVVYSADGNAAFAEWVMTEVGIKKVMFDVEHEEAFESFDQKDTILLRESIEARPFKGVVVFKSKHLAELEQVQDEKTVLFFENATKEEFVALTKSMPDNPIALVGGAEEKIGLKNYDDLDDRLDHMLM